MALNHWADYHEARVPRRAYLLAFVLLPESDQHLLTDHATLDRDRPDYRVPRAAVESIALTLPPNAGACFLALTYELDAATGKRLLGIIAEVKALEQGAQ